MIWGKTSWVKSIVLYVTFFSSECFSAVNTIVETSPSNRCRLWGRDRARSKTIRIGFRPYQLRTVSDGLSSNAVRLPTMIASASALFLCTSIEERGEDSTTGLSSVRSISIKWSADSAHLSVIKGRCSVLKVIKRRIRCRHSFPVLPLSLPFLRPATSESLFRQPAKKGLGNRLQYGEFVSR